MARKKKVTRVVNDKLNLIEIDPRKLSSELKKARTLAVEHSPDLSVLTPLIIDSNTTLYLTDAQLEKRGGLRGYLKYYEEKRKSV
jgi:hypothetical protein